MNRKKIKIIAVVLCVCLLAGTLYQSGVLKAWNTIQGPIGPDVVASKNTRAKLGTDANPFTVLEIVPEYAMAQFGYFIPGCEPVDMDKAKYTSHIMDLSNSHMNGIYSYDTTGKDYAFYDQIPANDYTYIDTSSVPSPARTDLIAWNNQKSDSRFGIWKASSNSSYSERGDYVPTAGGPLKQGFFTVGGASRNWNGGGDYTPEYVGAGQGYMRKSEGWENWDYVGHGQGDYILKYVGVGNGGDYNIAGYTLEVAEGSGADIKAGCVYVGFGNGNCAWVASESGSEVRTPNGDLFECGRIEYTHLDPFIKGAFKGRSSENFRSQVITVATKDFPSKEHPGTHAGCVECQERVSLLNQCIELVETADLIFCHGPSGDAGAMIDNYFELNKRGETEPAGFNRKTTFTDVGYDIPAKVALGIAKRMGSDSPAALIIDSTNMWGNSDAQKECNCHKLLYMVQLYKPSFFWNTFSAYLAEEEGTYDSGYAKIVYTKAGVDANGKVPYPYSHWGVSIDKNDPEWLSNWKKDDWKYGDVQNPFMFDPVTGECLMEYCRYYNVGCDGPSVFDKIFTYKGDNSMLSLLLGTGKDVTYHEKSDFGTTVTSDAFVGKDKNDGLTNMDVIRFILSAPSYTPKLRVLEIEGCDEFIYGSDGWMDYYQALFPWYEPQTKEDNWLKDEDLIEITTMPTWEFICSLGRYDYDARDRDGNKRTLTTESSDDLIAKYDLILIGAKQNAANGANGYNMYHGGDAKTAARGDNSVDLGHLIYTSIGGTYSNGAVSTNVPSAVQMEELDMRHTGNDITLKRLLELQDFLRAGKPIVIASELYSGSSVDTSKVDPDSKLYDLLTWSGAGSSNRLVYGSSALKNNIEAIITQNVCRLVFDSEGYPYEYWYTADSDGAILKEYGRTHMEDGRAVMEFRFRIDSGDDGESGDKYKVYLNLDLNGDGVYAGSLKEEAEVLNMNAATGEAYTLDTSEKRICADLEVYDSDGARIQPEAGEAEVKLEGGLWYTVKYKLPPMVQGMVPWKLEVQSCTNPKLRSSAIDYTVIKTEAKKETIHVLQMNPAIDMEVSGVTDWVDASFTRKSITLSKLSNKTYANFAKLTEAERLDNKIFSKLGAEQKKTVQKFEKYIEPVGEFDVDIHYMFNSDWQTLFGNSSSGLEDWMHFLADYDMIVIGFRDTCVFSGTSTFAEGVKDFVAQGKSMIISHDTVVGTRDRGNRYGEYGSWLRTIAGQRRAYYNNQGNGTYVKSYNEVKANGKLLSFVSPYNLNPLVDDKGNETENPMKRFLQQLTKAVDGESVEERFLDSWVNDWPDNENFMQLCASGKFGSSGEIGSIERVTKNGANLAAGWVGGSYVTNYVKLTNNGQITNYPYKIGEVIEVLGTHTQNCQLDLEYQQSGDVNVWFTLSDLNDPDVKAYAASKGLGGNQGVNVYSAKDMDGRNSFYIYNKGNVTYTGSGHGGGQMTNDEVMLFVNTMISAYRQPESRPRVSIDNSDTTAADGTEILYLDYEEKVAQTPAGGLMGALGDGNDIFDHRLELIDGRYWVAIEFSVYDNQGQSEVTDKNCYVRLSHGSSLMDPGNVKVWKLGADGLRSGSELVALGATSPYYRVDASAEGEKYVMYVPYTDVQSEGAALYSIGAYATYTKNRRFVTTTTSSKDAQLMFLPLFDLN